MKNTGINEIPSVKGHITSLTANLLFISVFYLFLGASVSFWLSELMPRFDDKWRALPISTQLIDVSLELSIIVILSFWITYITRILIPVVPLKLRLEYYLESFGGQVSFLYAVFIFMETLDDKLTHVFKTIFGRK
jgi:hypothetical protein